MEQNRIAQKIKEEQDKIFNQSKMMQNLEDLVDPNPDEESSDAAPVSPFADL